MLSCAFFTLFLTVASSNLWAQFTSAIDGTVTDQTGAVVANATVTLTNEETGISQTIQTQENALEELVTPIGGMTSRSAENV